MDRVAIFVDAGYVFAQGAAVLTGQKRPRSQLRLRPDELIRRLEDLAGSESGLPVLRTYWYDGTSSGPSAQPLTMAHLPGVKIRLGFVNSVGEQKGVDSLIVTDMITLARNRGMADALLVSGDEDLRVGVQQAQEFGVRVHLLGMKPSRGSQSGFLPQEADPTHEWDEMGVAEFLEWRAPGGEPRVPVSRTQPVAEDALRAIAGEIARQVPLEDLAAMVEGLLESGTIPREFDAPLLARAGQVLGARLVPAQKRKLREEFGIECKRRIAASKSSRG